MTPKEKLRVAQQRYLLRYPERRARTSRIANWKKSGINVAEADAALAKHNNGHCQICGTNTPGGTGAWHVDHNHETGKVRGILCSNCNRGLGYFHDDYWIVFMASEYLGRPA